MSGPVSYSSYNRRTSSVFRIAARTFSSPDPRGLAWSLPTGFLAASRKKKRKAAKSTKRSKKCVLNVCYRVDSFTLQRYISLVRDLLLSEKPCHFNQSAGCV